jgi:hypothetical protein
MIRMIEEHIHLKKKMSSIFHICPSPVLTYTGANASAVDKDGESALHYAAASGDGELTSELISAVCVCVCVCVVCVLCVCVCVCI